MTKFFILVLSLICSTAFAQTAAEEAIILNQELQYLEDSVKNIQAKALDMNNNSQTQRALNEPSLEKQYFGNDFDEDRVNTKSAAPKRRGL